MKKNYQHNKWDESYERGENFLFYPHEEIVRFCSKYLKKRVDIHKYEIIDKDAKRVLDVGCGLGRHAFFFDDAGFDTWGIDISESALTKAREYALELKKEHMQDRFLYMSSDKITFDDAHFNVVVSHGVIDSMSFGIAQATVKEIDRVLTEGGYVYMDLISGDDSHHAQEFFGEVAVDTTHERGTIQSYFNYHKILQLLNKTDLILLESVLIKKTDVIEGAFKSRWHLVLQKTKDNKIPK